MPSDTTNPMPLLPLLRQRWMPRQKEMVISAVRDGTLTVEQVCRRYELSREELDGWIAAFERYGPAGLRSTRVQIYGDLRKPIRLP